DRARTKPTVCRRVDRGAAAQLEPGVRLAFRGCTHPAQLQGRGEAATARRAWAAGQIRTAAFAGLGLGCRRNHRARAWGWRLRNAPHVVSYHGEGILRPWLEQAAERFL